MAWPTTVYNGEEYYKGEGEVLVPVSGTGVAMVMMRKNGGVASGVSAIETGPPGVPANLDEEIPVTELKYDDPTPMSGHFTTLTPPTNETPGLWQLNLALREGKPGKDGDTVLNPNDFANPSPGRVPAVNAAGDGFELVPQRVGDRYLPADVRGSGVEEAKTTVAVVPVPPQEFDWRPDIEASCAIQGNDVRVDLIARLNKETDGNDVGRCIGVAASERLQITSAPPPGSDDNYDKIPAGVAAQIYIRVEKQTGAGTFTVSASTVRAAVKVRAVD